MSRNEFVDEFVQAVQEVFPGCCIHLEDSAIPVKNNHRRVRSTDNLVLTSPSVNSISGNTIPNRPMLWKDETNTAPASAPKIKLIHIAAKVCMVRRAGS